MICRPGSCVQRFRLQFQSLITTVLRIKFEFQIKLLGDPAVVRPGVFLTALLNFLIVAAALYFFVVVPINAMNKRKDAMLDLEKTEDDTEVSPEVLLLTEIRDSLKTSN